MKGYQVDTDTYIEVTKERLDETARESTRPIAIDESCEADIARRTIRPYDLGTDGKVGHEAFAVIRRNHPHHEQGRRSTRVLTTPRTTSIALEPLGQRLDGDIDCATL